MKSAQTDERTAVYLRAGGWRTVNGVWVHESMGAHDMPTARRRQLQADAMRLVYLLEAEASPGTDFVVQDSILMGVLAAAKRYFDDPEVQRAAAAALASSPLAAAVLEVLRRALGLPADDGSGAA